MNHSELEYKHPKQPVPLVNMFLEKVQYSRTALNSRERDPTPFFLRTKVVQEGSRRLFPLVIMFIEKVQYSPTTYTPCFLRTEVVQEGSRRFDAV